MFGITLLEVVFFGQQLGLAIAGAAALWGFVFVQKGQHNQHGSECVTFDWLSKRLLYALYTGAAIAIFSWLVLLMLYPAEAHEGIVLLPETSERFAALKLVTPVYFAWVLLFLPLGLLTHVTPTQFHRRLSLFYATHFVLAFFLMSFSVWSAEMSTRQLFFVGHSFHSIFTLGTVLILDFLFLLSKTSFHLKHHLYPLFPTISKVILVGLAIEFLSVSLVFSDAIALTPKFYFMQTLVGVLLINGAILSGPLTRRLLQTLKEGHGKLRGRWELLGDVTGTVSVTSWFTITLVDFFSELSLSFSMLIVIYGLVLIAASTVHVLWVRLQRDPVFDQLISWHRGSGVHESSKEAISQ